MRPLEKLPPPKVLEDNWEQWTDEYVAAILGDGSHPGYWGHAEIREALRRETSERCAYCEARVAHVAYEHVEHILPKKHFPRLAHDWGNLTTACPVCNTKKGHYFSSEEPLINPYVDVPTDHIGFQGGIPYARNGSRRGFVSIKKLGLDRLQLVVDRGQRLCAVATLVHTWERAEGGMKEALYEAVVTDVEDGEYPTAVRELLEALGFPLDRHGDHRRAGQIEEPDVTSD